jgi:hypothetical protein
MSYYIFIIIIIIIIVDWRNDSFLFNNTFQNITVRVIKYYFIVEVSCKNCILLYCKTELGFFLRKKSLHIKVASDRFVYFILLVYDMTK